MLLVHGMLASRAQWLRNTEALGAVCRPVVVELFGHGRSPSPGDPAAYRPEGYVAAFEALRREIGADRWLVCGQSLGAALTLRYSLDYPDRVLAQVFTNSNSALAGEGWGEALRPSLEQQQRELERQGLGVIESMPIHPARARHLPFDVKTALVQDCKLHDPRGLGMTGRYTVMNSPVRDRIGENRVPTLLAVGTRETRFADQAAWARTHVPGLEVVELSAGHAVNVEASAGFNAAVIDFVRRHAT